MSSTEDFEETLSEQHDIDDTTIRQCRLCLRNVLQRDAHDAWAEQDLRDKALEAVAIEITESDVTTWLCTSCLQVVNIIYDFRTTCRKSNTLLANHLLKVEAPIWNNEDTRERLEKCQEIITWHQSEIDLIEFRLKCRKEQDEIQKQQKTEHFSIQDQPKTIKLKTYVSQIKPARKKPDPDQPKPTSGSKSRGSSTYICEMCGARVQTSSREFHVNRHYNRKPYRCPEDGCGETFYSKPSAKAHVTYRHTNFYDPVACEICHRMVKGPFLLDRHMKTHADSNPLKVPCPICGKSFYRQYLKDHEALHTGVQKYSCEYCGRRFTARGNISAHKRKCSKKPTEDCQDSS
ncbi:zinc finger protein 69 homolog [Topomyia yanbarensis]|uniref:zinc finger protein 69 homolog n=1 Tax=Topomyia yanbarensis TaxID=2498891 RepID=UPI00273B90AB|nr:zinc finger protein 69 homolog [Topomyia yanbarensis]